MYKLIVLFLSFASLSASTIQFPVDQPVIQSSKFSYERGRFLVGNQTLDTVLMVKDASNYRIDMEISYRDIVYACRHGAPGSWWVHLHFDSKTLKGGTRCLPEWNQLVKNSHLITVFKDYVYATESNHCFWTSKNNYMYRSSLYALTYVCDKDLNVGDSFRVNIELTQSEADDPAKTTCVWEYVITAITDEDVFYTVKSEGALGGGGTGHWRRENGLIGEIDFCMVSEGNEWISKGSEWRFESIATPY